MIHCKKCGFSINEKDMFCFNCGTPNSNFSAPEKDINLGNIPVLNEKEKDEIKNEANNVSQVEPELTQLLGFENCEQDFVSGDQITEELYPEKKIETYAALNYLEDGLEKEYLMTGNLILIGRDSKDCDFIILKDKYLGRLHVLIFFKDNNFFIVDLNSKNGTFVNDEKVEGLKKINDGDLIKVATTEIKFKRLID